MLFRGKLVVYYILQGYNLLLYPQDKTLRFCPPMLFSDKVTSETTREKYKNEVLNSDLNNKPSNLFEWGQYLAGVFEGDGYFNANHGITITFHIKDLNSAYKLVEWFGHGHVNPVKNKNAVNWVITNYEGVKKFLFIINGHLRTENKLNQILYNTTGKFTPSNFGINFQTVINNNPINCGWWLAGFTDSDGSFVIQIPENRNQIRLLLKFGCSFKNKNILDQLSAYYGGSVFLRTHKNNVYSWYWSSPYSLKTVMEIYRYFRIHTLQSNKLNDFHIWRECLLIILNKPHTTTSGRQLCISLRESLKSIR